jgi:hypothetical protein
LCFVWSTSCYDSEILIRFYLSSVLLI